MMRPVGGLTVKRLALSAAVVALALVAAAPAGAGGRYDLCVLKLVGSQFQCTSTVVATALDSGDVMAGFRDRRARDELYQVCLAKPPGGCTTTRYTPKTGGDGKLMWSLVGVDNLGTSSFRPGRYTIAWYTASPHSRPKLIGRRRLRVTAPPGTLGRSMSIDAEIAHLFSPPPDGFDANSDGVIQTRDESVRADRNYDLWDGERLFLAAGQQRENITRSTLDAWFRSFDTNHDGRLTQTLRSGHSSGEFAQACRAVWGDPDACRYVTLTAFEKRA